MLTSTPYKFHLAAALLCGNSISAQYCSNIVMYKFGYSSHSWISIHGIIGIPWASIYTTTELLEATLLRQP